MNFNFPDNKAIFKDTIQNYHDNGGKGSFSLIDILNPKDNLIQIGGIDYFFTYLNVGLSGNKGGNSILMKLFDSQYIDTDDPQYDEPDSILKISKFKKSNSNYPSKQERRFVKEIEALNICQEKKFQNVIKVFNQGVCSIMNHSTKKYDEYLFYTMEYAEYDLKKYVEENFSVLTFDEKVALCVSLCDGLSELYTLDYYHRDIKPDNIFIVDSIWKIGDLGLVAERNKPNEIDKVAESIGPKGWMSPESMNKYLCDGKNFDLKHDCLIDHQSDIFQLGKVFWYIFQYNTPIGSVKERDFLIKNSKIYAIIKTMLSQSKARRFKDVSEVSRLLKLIEGDRLKKKVA
jgi:serine/threonine protein kinase